MLKGRRCLTAAIFFFVFHNTALALFQMTPNSRPCRSGPSPVNDPLSALASSPLIYPQKLDLGREAVLLIEVSEAQYRAASFLDDRILSPETKGAWAPLSRVTAVAPAPEILRPLHFIFHMGHVGSTLVSRLIDETGLTLGVREPLPLRTLADVHDTLGAPDSLLSPGAFASTLETFLRLWARGLPATRAVVLKATSSASRLGHVLMGKAPTARALYLSLRPEPYLATLLAGANAAQDLWGHGPERIRRIGRLIGGPQAPLHALSIGELAAMSWLAEKLTEAQLVRLYPDRVIALDFETLLSALEPSLDWAMKHFGLDVPATTIASIARGPVLTRYSKAPDQYAYSRQMRRELLAGARQTHAQEILRGMAFLEAEARRSDEVARLL